MNQKQNKIKNDVAKEIRNLLGDIVKDIFLFGSRARGDNDKMSDYDIMVVLQNETISNSERAKITISILKLLANMRVPADVVVRSLSEMKEYSKISGSLSNVVINEGILL